MKTINIFVKVVTCPAIDLATELYLLPCGRKHATLVPRSIAIIVDLPKNVLVATVCYGGIGDNATQAGKGGPLVIIDRKPKL